MLWLLVGCFSSTWVHSDGYTEFCRNWFKSNRRFTIVWSSKRDWSDDGVSVSSSDMAANCSKRRFNAAWWNVSLSVGGNLPRSCVFVTDGGWNEKKWIFFVNVMSTIQLVNANCLNGIFRNDHSDFHLWTNELRKTIKGKPKILSFATLHMNEIPLGKVPINGFCTSFLFVK